MKNFHFDKEQLTSILYHNLQTDEGIERLYKMGFSWGDDHPLKPGLEMFRDFSLGSLGKIPLLTIDVDPMDTVNENPSIELSIFLIKDGQFNLNDYAECAKIILFIREYLQEFLEENYPEFNSYKTVDNLTIRFRIHAHSFIESLSWLCKCAYEISDLKIDYHLFRHYNLVDETTGEIKSVAENCLNKLPELPLHEGTSIQKINTNIHRRIELCRNYLSEKEGVGMQAPSDQTAAA